MNHPWPRRRPRGAKFFSGCLFFPAFFFAVAVRAAIVGTNSPVVPLTAERIHSLPVRERGEWGKFLTRSEAQRKVDQKFFHDEMKRHGAQKSVFPPLSAGVGSMPLNQPAAWYGSAEARRIADNIVSFQTPAGGWGKNLDIGQHSRAPGELFAPENSSRFITASDFDSAVEAVWNYVGTIDNDATVTELQFLAKVISAASLGESEIWRASFSRGVNYLLAAQYPNGGWPQVWPLQGGYQDSIALNDGAMINVMDLLQSVSEARGEFSFVPPDIRARTRDSLKRGLECTLALQVVSHGRRTIWCQQYDPLTLAPAPARNYEMPALASGESAGVMMFLMRLPDPSPAVIAAVHSAAAWFEKNKIMDVAFKSAGPEGRLLVPAPGNGPLWARYCRIGDDQPLFGDRDKTIHDRVAEISRERRQGYAWYTDTAKRGLQHYGRWSKVHPRAP